jgi:hypothetical protein
MKTDTHDDLNVAAREQGAILDQIRNDHELIDRLKITHQELDALARCELLGTLTCKQDMLFILRQIREAGDPEHATKIPPPVREREEDPVPDFTRMAVRIAPIAIDSAAFDRPARRRIPVPFGPLFWVLILVAGLVWNGMIALSRWRDSIVATASTAPVAQMPTPDAWYNRIDGPRMLLWWEILFVGTIAIVMYLKTRKTNRSPKVRPVRRLR